MDSGALKYIATTIDGLLLCYFENVLMVSGLSLGKPGIDYFGPKRPLLNCCKLPGIDFFCHPFFVAAPCDVKIYFTASFLAIDKFKGSCMPQLRPFKQFLAKVFYNIVSCTLQIFIAE